MAQRFSYFLVVLMLMFAKENFAQSSAIKTPVRINTPRLMNNQLTGFSIEAILQRATLLKNENHKFIRATRFITSCNFEDLFKNYYTVTSNSPSLYFNLFAAPSYKPVALFCVAEDKFEKQTSIPLRLRLGSLDYTNYLEQKPNAVKPLY
jgi:hypothetical protein